MEGMTRKDTPSSKRYTVPEAAKVLGIGTDAVRKRIARGTIPHEKDAAGRVYVCLDTGHDEGHDERHVARELSPELVQSLREQIGYLQGVIATRDEELRTRAEELRRRDQDLERRDRIIAALTERIPQALEPPSEARESPESSGPADGLLEVQDELDTERARREMAESTLREGMDEEGRRREEAERERDDLRQQLEAISAARAAPQTVEEEPERAEPRPATGGTQEGVRRPWWRRWFGG
jgi:excisionase family DNA binding protein